MDSFDDGLLLYNRKTNQVGYLPPIYYYHPTSSSFYITSFDDQNNTLGNYEQIPSNLWFLTEEDNDWCCLTSSGSYMYNMFKPKIRSCGATSPGFIYDNDEQCLYYGTLDKGEHTHFGSYSLYGDFIRSSQTGSGDFNITTSPIAHEYSNIGTCGWSSGNIYWRKSGAMTPQEGLKALLKYDEYFNKWDSYYASGVKKIGYNECLPVGVMYFAMAGTSVYNIYPVYLVPGVYGWGSLSTYRGPYPTNISSSLTDGNIVVDDSRGTSCEYVSYSSGWYRWKNYLSNPSSITPMVNYVNRHFNGVMPENVGDLSVVLEEPKSIYSPGGTTTNPHDPYPTPIVDPLDSGTETDSPNTDGTWTLPFDTVSLDHARVDSSQAGVYRLVGLTQQQLSAMADYMFSDTSVTEAWENLMKLIYGNVVDTIIGIQEFPMDVSDSVGTDIFCFIGRDITTGMFVGKALTSEYCSLDFGSIEVPRYSGTFYDFEPYTTLTLYIPYVGYIDMKPTEVVGSTLYISGWVHLSTGEVTINVRSSRTGLLGSYSGNIGRNLPISSADATRLYAAIIETAAGLGGYATFGAGVSAMGGIEHADPHNMNVARGEYAQSVKAYGAAKRGVRGVQATMLEKQAAYEQAKEEFSSAKTTERQQIQAAERAEREFNEAGLEAYSNAIDAVTSGFEVVRGTHMTPGAGRTSPQVCFLRIEVPHQNVSKNQKLLGYPCNSAEVLNSDKLHGYTELRMIDLQIPGITLTELQELESILKGGFYLP